jgi:alpha-methylacyl-CoA racemase
LKNERDREFLLKDIIPQIHVFLESYRPGVMERLGLAPEVVHGINPKIIYVRLSGYGQVASRFKDLAGHDQNYLSVTGILNKFKRMALNNGPSPPSNFLADFACGSLYCFNLIL